MADQTDAEMDRIIGMAWEDRTPFEAIAYQFGLSERDVIKIMRQNLKHSSFRLWRKRVNSSVSKKHRRKRQALVTKFRSSRQRLISNNKIAKR